MHLKKLEKNIQLKRSTVIIGVKGTGKTYLLRQLPGIYVDYPSAKQIISAIMINHRIAGFRWASIPEQLELIRKYLQSTTLLLDNCEIVYKPTVRFLERLQDEGVTLICASERKLSFCREKVELKAMSPKQSRELIKQLVRTIHPTAMRIIVHKSLGNSGKIIELVKDYQLGIKYLQINPNDEASIVNYFLDLRPQMPERIDIFPVWLLFALGFGALAVKTIFFDSGSWHEGYMIASLGYLVLIVYRMLQESRKRRN